MNQMDLEEKRRREVRTFLLASSLGYGAPSHVVSCCARVVVCCVCQLLGGSSLPGPAGGAGAGAGAGGDGTEGDDAGRAALLNGGKAKPAAAGAATAAADGAGATDGEGDLPEVDVRGCDSEAPAS